MSDPNSEIDVAWSFTLESSNFAQVLKNSLDVDEEYNKEFIDRRIETDGGKVTVKYRT